MSDLRVPRKAFAKSRLYILVAFFVFPAVILSVRIFLLSYQGALENSSISKAYNDYHSGNFIDGVRAEITDRHGVTLSRMLKTYALYVNPTNVLDKEELAEQVTKIFPDLRYKSVIKKLNGNSHVALKRPISPRKAQMSHDLGLPGLYYRSRHDRMYTTGEVLPHVIGGVNIDNRGIAGIEAFFDDELQKISIPLELSVDLSIQSAVYEELKKAAEDYNSIGAAAIIMNAHNGEIISIASYPSFDGNNRPSYGNGVPLENQATLNRAVQMRYEPGSVMKILTWAQALETGQTRIDEEFSFEKQYIEVEGRKFFEAHRIDQNISLREAFEKSSNVVAIKLALRSEAYIHKYFFENLGLLDRLDVELVEAAGVISPSKWNKHTRATVSFGYGIAMTPLHVATLYAALANGGYKVTPTLLTEKGRQTITNNDDKNVRSREKIFSEETSKIITDFLYTNVENGTGKLAKIEGYKVGGKTGTAEKIKKNGRGYQSNKVISTFAAVFPLPAPKYVIVVVLDEPVDQSAGYPRRSASFTAAPVAGAMLKRVLPLMGILPRL